MRKIDSLFQKNEKKYWLVYTIIFVLITAAVFSFFTFSGRTLVRRLDAWMQHYKALIYYARWLRSIVMNVVENHSFSIPSYSFSMGYGSDIITTLHYYVIGDPLNLLCLFVPVRYMYHLYGGLIILRLYLAGISFSCFCFYMGRDRKSTLTGALVYIFSGFSLCYSVINPYFVNPMIYFPLLLLGVEKILKEKKPGLFIGMVFLSAVSNFYFFYMLALFTAMYTVFRLVMRYGKTEIRKAVCCLLHIGGYAVTGVLLSAFLFLPVILAFLDCPRTGMAVYNFWPSLEYLRKFPEAFLTYTEPGMWTTAGYSVVVLAAVLFLFMHRGNRHFKFLFVLLTVFLVFPVFGHIFNGFSYVANRWIWVYSTLLSYMVAFFWPRFKAVSKRELIRLSFLTAMFLGLCVVLSQRVSRSLFVSGIMAGLFLTALFLQQWHKKEQLTEFFLLGVVLLGIYGNAYCYFSEHSRNMIAQFKRQETINDELYDTVDQAVLSLREDEEFYRYSGHAYDTNSTVLSDLSGVDYYWSLSPGSFFEWWSQTAVLENTYHFYHTLDDRTALNTLSGVKYFVTAKENGHENYVPYGYSEITIKDEEAALKYRLYENDYALPLGYVYKEYISSDTFAEFTPLERQEAMMQGIVLEEGTDICGQAKPEVTSRKLDYVMEYNDGEVELRDSAFVIKKENSAVTLLFDGMEKAETYLYMDGLYYQKEDLSMYDLLYQTEPDTLEIVFQSDHANGTTIQKTLIYRTDKEIYTTGRHDFLAHMGYDDAKKKTITIIFPETGIYEFDSLDVLGQPMESYAGQSEALRENVLENPNMHYLPVNDAPSVTDTVTGNITMDSAGVLCVTIPYSRGWNAYVDGKKQALLKANIMFMGLELEAGEHEIRLVYETPGLRLGMIISFASLSGLIIFMAMQKRRNRGNMK